jgi:hypothetical protein
MKTKLTSKDYEILNKRVDESVKDIFDTLNCFKNTQKGDVEMNPVAEMLLILVKENSNDFTKDIAEKCLSNFFNPSTKQNWAICYQIVNNREIYKLACKSVEIF